MFDTSTPPVQGSLPDNSNYPYRPCYVDVHKLFGAEQMPNGYARQGTELDTSCLAVGWVSRWLRGIAGEWIAVVSYSIATNHTQPPQQFADQLVPVRYLRKREDSSPE